MANFTPNYNLRKPLANENYDVEDQNGNMDKIDAALAEHKAEIAHIPYAAVTGTANTYAATINPAPVAYVEGLALAVKINVNNTGASTINVNGLGAKSIKKSNGNDITSGNLKAGSVYTLRYNGTNFILQGEGGEYGTAQAGDVLTGKTIGTEDGIINGTMPNHGTHNITPGISNIIIPEGYHNGNGVVSSLGGNAIASDVLTGKSFSSDSAGRAIAGSMANRTGHVTAQSSSASGTTLRFRPQAGFYPGDTGNSVQYSDANFVASNIKQGVPVFGLTGTHKDIVVCRSINKLCELGYMVNVNSPVILHDYLEYTGNSSSAVSDIAAVISNPIDLTGVNTLTIDWELLRSGGINRQIEIGLIVSTSKMDGWGTYNARVTDITSTGNIARSTKTLNVSSLSGLFYIRFHIYKSVAFAGSETFRLRVFDLASS